MLRPYIKLLISELKLRVIDIDVLLIKVSNTDGRRLILHYRDHTCFSCINISGPEEAV